METSWVLPLRLGEFNPAAPLRFSMLQASNVCCEGFTLFSNIDLGKRTPHENCVANVYSKQQMSRTTQRLRICNSLS